MTVTDAPRSPVRTTRPPIWRDVRVLRVVLQAAFAVVVVAFFVTIYRNLIENLEAQNIRTDFQYLENPAGFPILGSSFDPAQPISEALLVGVQNTIACALVGIVGCTILGTLIGIGRLSSNWVVSKVAQTYVEIFRNLPPLLVIIAVNTIVVLNLFPETQQAWNYGDLLLISNKGVAMASIVSQSGAVAFLVGLAIALVVAFLVMVWRTRRSIQTGEPHHRWLWGGGIVLFSAIFAWFATGGPYELERPMVGEFQLEGGLGMTAAYFALTLALTLYTASHVAEIVRGSINAVPRGQSEAAQSIALSSFQRYRYVVLPQAFRVATPAMINQYLNLTKNTSLGLAISYLEITTVTRTAIGNGAPAPQSILVLMAIYLTLSLIISLIANQVNRRLQLVEN